ncbi:MAG: CapA family protein [Holosporales bacterium]|jgi:poly-gamma-glutamate synthesis protein (capsule biosynthesis protein)|nr:CapA family protein [Holosporales bacterium]
MGKKKIVLDLVSDVYIQREDPENAFQYVNHIFKAADVVFGNQEACLSTKGINRGRFQSNPEMVASLVAGGFDVVGLANNHSMDRGAEGIMETIETLDKAGIAHCGAGKNIDEAHKPVIIERESTNIAFLSYTSVFLDHFQALADRAGVAVVKLRTSYRPPERFFEVPGMPAIVLTEPEQDSVDRMKQDIANAKTKADIVVISWHWGISQSYRLVAEYQREMGKLAIDAGADLIVGHHPHVVQGVEIYKGKGICYCLGDFSFFLRHTDPRRFHHGSEAVVVECDIEDKQIQNISLIPLSKNENYEPVVATEEEGEKIFKKMQGLSEAYGTSMEFENGKILVKGVNA